ncbi:hypothetical protein KKF34_11075 [Myxococcota bacterium]|nr:hypothetical protein [Myxococcota bacterium]MBU1381531.1 hypothetical protein [Myxococcota bacterium]MBU1497406.1 hypothetical protein [Myxococcota bacterium]
MGHKIRKGITEVLLMMKPVYGCQNNTCGFTAFSVLGICVSGFAMVWLQLQLSLHPY